MVRQTISGITTSKINEKSRHIIWMFLPKGSRDPNMNTRDPAQQIDITAKNRCKTISALSRNRGYVAFAGSPK